MPATRLLTLLQISDLHIGEIDAVTGDASVSGATRKLVANTTWLDGLLGHHSRGLEHLARFWHQLRSKERNAKVVITGDITRCGGNVELNNAADFLADKLELPSGAVGLGLGDWRNYAIPGNHDHYPGRPIMFGKANEDVLSRLTSDCPGVTGLSIGSTIVQLIRIDTDADVFPFGRYRFLAKGSFQSQLNAIKTKLARATDYSVRVLLMHHSIHRRGSLSICRASRAALNQFLEEEDIHVVLTGHVHDPLVRKFSTTLGRRQLLECRGGTTTQIDKVAYDARTIFGGFPVRRAWPSNSLLVHRLYRTGTGLVWKTKTYTRLRRGFADVGAQGTVELRIR